MSIHDTGSLPGDRLTGFDFDSHNAEVKECWKAFGEHKPTRVPIILGTNTRYFVRNRYSNPEGVQFQQYTEDPDVMFDTKLRWQRWSRYNLLQDAELGLPETWNIEPDFQNYYDAAWFGCAIHFFDGEVPDTLPDFADCPERVMEHGFPDPFSGVMQKSLDYYEHFCKRAENKTYLGRPIKVGMAGAGMGTDGVMTVACNLFGPTFVCTAMASEPERLRKLFTFIRDAIISRMIAWRKLADIPVPCDYWGTADDSIALISTAMYREHVLSHHRVFFDTFANPENRSIHLCGNSSRHFVTIRDELGVTTFDTGFPIDFGKLRNEVGRDVQINGGPHIELLRSETPDAVRLEVKRILETGILEGGRFLLREGNNLAPETPIENTEAMYRAGREFGRLS